jgi:hypothetical protein
MRTITRIDPTSAMKVGALLSALSFTVFGLLLLAFQSLLLSALSNSSSSSSGVSGSSILAAGMVGLCVFYGIGVIGATISGGIGGLVVAFAYNLTANWVGGLRIELDDAPTAKPKRRVTIVPADEEQTGF